MKPTERSMMQTELLQVCYRSVIFFSLLINDLIMSSESMIAVVMELTWI